jgi:hypothetical protein
MTSGIETATFRLVAQYLNQLRYRVPRKKNKACKICCSHGGNYEDLQDSTAYSLILMRICSKEDLWGQRNSRC